MDQNTGRAYCPALSHYAVIYSSGRAAFYVHKRWDIKKLQAASGDDWARITIGEDAEATTIWFIYSPIQTTSHWNTPLTSILPVNRAVLVGDFNTHHPLWDIHGRSSRGSSELAAYILRWNLILHTSYGEITRHRHGQRTSTIDLAMATPSVTAAY
jgi:hypothetical protein